MSQPVMRQDPLTGRWVIFSTSRASRPIRLADSPVTASINPVDDPFAPGNERETPSELFAIRRDGSSADTPGWDLRIVPNRYPAVSIRPVSFASGELLAYGYHEVIIETPRDETHFSRLTATEIADVFFSVKQRMRSLREDSRLQALVYFKNEGRAAGASLPHVHSQLLGLDFIPPYLQEEFEATLRYWQSQGMAEDRNWFESILESELAKPDDSRIVECSHSMVSLCPYASRYAFETCLIPTRRNASFLNSTVEEIEQVAFQLHRILNALMRIAPDAAYNLALHTSPLRQEVNSHYHWHVKLLPRLNGLAGLECGFGCHLNTIFPEQAACVLRENLR